MRKNWVFAWLLFCLMLPPGLGAQVADSSANCSATLSQASFSAAQVEMLLHRCGPEGRAGLLAHYRNATGASATDELTIVSSLRWVRAADVFDAAIEHLSRPATSKVGRLAAIVLLVRQWSDWWGVQSFDLSLLSSGEPAPCGRFLVSDVGYRLRQPLPRDSVARTLSALQAAATSDLEPDVRMLADCALTAISATLPDQDSQLQGLRVTSPCRATFDFLNEGDVALTFFWRSSRAGVAGGVESLAPGQSIRRFSGGMASILIGTGRSKETSYTHTDTACDATTRRDHPRYP